MAEAFRARGDEFLGHGRTNSERQGALAEAEEAALIREATATICEHEGRHPRGWLGPWISESRVTPDLLQEAGYDFVLDWCMDDQPVWMKTRRGRMLAVPYPQELNDIPAIVGRKMNGDAFADMIVDQFDEMLRQSRDMPLVMGIALHPYIVGQPHRLKHLRRALAHVLAHRQALFVTRAGAIARIRPRAPGRHRARSELVSRGAGTRSGRAERPGSAAQPRARPPLASRAARKSRRPSPIRSRRR